ncbi:calcineurin-like phosphoesterase family protein [uncultured Bacteroides sp.]|uniref:calcineurin-like phosphoesterase family protein n=1 Tax=uncultured Bacteroides sp. TaxID=162156 RepID=UPI0025E3B344|nr:calcineurin-like phosphoesterase family protein [uncultured Bacteroides sp.]
MKTSILICIISILGTYGNYAIALDNVVGRVTCHQKPVPNVLISDGVEVVKTDAEGYFRFNSEKEDGYVFISVPGNYEVGHTGIIPNHFARLTKGRNEVDTVNFYLTERENEDCEIFMFTDIHLTNDRVDNDLSQFGNTFYPDIVSQLESRVDKPVYAICLGDMTTDGKWHINNYGLPEYLETMKDFPIPIYHTMGNHDNERKVIDNISDWDFYGESVYKDVVGPNYYSFNIGAWHVMILDNIITGGPVKKNGKQIYQFTYRIDEQQMEWIKKDLSFISKNTPIMVGIHVPPLKYKGMKNGVLETDYAFENAKEFLSCYAEFNQVQIFAGHTHKSSNYVYGDNITLHNLPSSSAVSWKINGKTSRLISEDGSPAGYWMIKIKGNNLQWQFKAAERDLEKSQFFVYDLNCVPEKFGGNKNSNEILINIYNWDPAWKVDVTEKGHSLDVSHCWTRDPLYRLIRSDKNALPGRPTAFLASYNSHMFKVKTIDAKSTIHIRITDRFGNVYETTVKRPKKFSWNME